MSSPSVVASFRSFLFVQKIRHTEFSLFPQNYDNSTGQVIFHGDPGVIEEGHKIFLSGHNSCNQRPPVLRGAGLPVVIPDRQDQGVRPGWSHRQALHRGPSLLLAAMVVVSRLDDYWHHWQDVFAGRILGRCQEFSLSKMHQYVLKIILPN